MSTKPFSDDPTQPYEQPSSNTQRSEVNRWCCLNCGQIIFVVIDTEPPDVCEYCQDMTTWEHVENHSID